MVEVAGSSPVIRTVPVAQWPERSPAEAEVSGFESPREYRLR